MTDFIDIENEIQHVSGTAEQDTFKINGSAADYQWDVAEDGVGVVVWNDAGYDVLTNIETIEFDDVLVTSNGSGDFVVDPLVAGQGVSWTHTDGKNENITGTTADDTFEVAERASFWNWGLSEDGIGVVIWKGDEYVVLHDVEQIQFEDMTLTFANGVLTPQWQDDVASVTLTDTADEVDHYSGTPNNNDSYVLDGNTSDYQWSMAEDNVGIVVWDDNEYNVLYDIENLVFNDGVVTYLDGEFSAPSSGDSGNDSSTDDDTPDTVDVTEAIDDIEFTEINAPLIFFPTSNDLLADGVSATYDSITQPVNGLIEVNADGSMTYTPDTGFEGIDTFTYTIIDSAGTVTSASVTIDVGFSGGSGFALADDLMETATDTPVTIDVLGNDSGDSLAIFNVTQPTNGTAALNTDGTITYVPDDGFSGDDSFLYYVIDGEGNTDESVVTVTVGGDSSAGEETDGSDNGDDSTAGNVYTDNADQNDLVEGTDSDSDVFVIDADSAAYSWEQADDGSILVTSSSNLDVLIGVEQIRFNDLVVTRLDNGEFATSQTSGTDDSGTDTEGSTSTDSGTDSSIDDGADDNTDTSTDSSTMIGLNLISQAGSEVTIPAPALYLDNDLVVSGDPSVDSSMGSAAFDAKKNLVFTPTDGFEGEALIEYEVLTATGAYEMRQLPLQVQTELQGADSADILLGSAGDDTMTGGAGVDIFVASEGTDTITDMLLDDGDILDIGNILPEEFSSSTADDYVSFAQDGENGVITVADDNGGSNSVVLENVDLSGYANAMELLDSDFVLY